MQPVAGGSVAVTGLPWKTATTLAIGAAVSSVVLTALQYLGRLTNLSFWPDTLVRLGKTFLGSLAAASAPTAVGRVPARMVATYSSPSTLPTATYLSAIRR